MNIPLELALYIGVFLPPTGTSMPNDRKRGPDKVATRSPILSLHLRLLQRLKKCRFYTEYRVGLLHKVLRKSRTLMRLTRRGTVWHAMR